MSKEKKTAVLLLTCSDKVGLVAKITRFIFENGGNIISLNEHVDPGEQIFSIRVAWDMSGFKVPAGKLKKAFAPLAKEFKAVYDVKIMEERSNVVIFVSKYDHCLHEILWRNSRDEYPINIKLIISNHADLKPLAEQYKVPFFHYEITPETKSEQEDKELELLTEYKIDTIVLARYMQILSEKFVTAYPNQIINIHHSFLPAFIGGNPYKQAYQRGVKIIGATSHYVTEDLDEGPIIEQDIIRITHKDSLKDLIRKGRDLERLVLAKALQYHFEHKVLVRGRKTIIFD